MNEMLADAPGKMDWFDDELDPLRDAIREALRDHSAAKAATNRAIVHNSVVKVLQQQYLTAATGLSPLSSILATAPSIPDILGELLDAGQDCGVSRIRYYHYCERSGEDTLVSVDSAGHDDQTASRLRIGAVVKFRSSSPLRTVDSFWCIALGVPIGFVLDENALAIRSTAPPAL